LDLFCLPVRDAKKGLQAKPARFIFGRICGCSSSALL
jgi:hypothetical protein